jgi:hypothetical protein
MAGLVPAIHVFASKESKTWMPGSSPGMTSWYVSPSQFQTHLHLLAAPSARVLVGVPALGIERAQGMPGARRARSLVCEMKKHTSIVTTVTPEPPGIPRTMV